MVTPDMTLSAAIATPTRHRRWRASELGRAARTGAVIVVALTAAATAAAVIDPSLGPGTRPHPSLTPGVSTALGIWQSNLRLLAVPFILAALRFEHTRPGRLLGDLIVAALTGYSTITVGLAIGRWQLTLAPYLPQLPLEWAALSLSVTAWLLIRSRHAGPVQPVALAATIAVLLAGAAVLETWATPRRAADDGHRAAAVSPPAIPSQASRPDGAPLKCGSAQRCLIADTPSNPDPFKGGITR